MPATTPTSTCCVVAEPDAWPASTPGRSNRSATIHRPEMHSDACRLFTTEYTIPPPGDRHSDLACPSSVRARMLRVLAAMRCTPDLVDVTRLRRKLEVLHRTRKRGVCHAIRYHAIRHIPRCQPAARDFKTRVDECRAHTLARFLDSVRSETDDGPGGQSARNIHLDEYRVGVNANDRGGMDGGEHTVRCMPAVASVSSTECAHRHTNAPATSLRRG